MLDVVGQVGRFYQVIIPGSSAGMAKSDESRRVPSRSCPDRPRLPFVYAASTPRRLSPSSGPPHAARFTAAPGTGNRGAWFRTGRIGGAVGARKLSGDRGQRYGFAFGGGVQVRLRNGAFFEGSLDQFRKTAERVFVYDDTVFRLGIPNTITVRPLLFTAGYRFRSSRRDDPVCRWRRRCVPPYRTHSVQR